MHFAVCHIMTIFCILDFRKFIVKYSYYVHNSLKESCKITGKLRNVAHIYDSVNVSGVMLE